MTAEIKLLRPQDQDAIMAFEKHKLSQQVDDEMEREFQSWHAKWRPEALAHYLPLGWSFAQWEGDRLLGYFLAQPILFFRGMTQTLWVEHVGFNEPEIARQLLEVAYKTAREKHLQKLLLHEAQNIKFALEAWSPTALEDGILEIKTAKL